MNDISRSAVMPGRVRFLNNLTSAGSAAGKGVAPWECVPRHIRAGGRSRGLQSKAWTGLPTGDIPSRELPADRTPMTSLLTNGRKRKFHFPLYRQNELIKRVEKKCGDMFLTRNIADKIAVQSVREKHRQAQSASECIVGHFPPAGEGIKSSPAGQIGPTHGSVADCPCR